MYLAYAIRILHRNPSCQDYHTVYSLFFLVMILSPETHRKASKYIAMLAQLNHFLVFYPVVYEKCDLTQNPSFLSLKVRYFSSSRLAHYNTTASSFRSSHASSPVFTCRLSRSVRSEAQEVLFDYLHNTRSLCFSDAEHISKNSPQFLQNLLLKIDTDKDVSWSLSKFLRYNPINEFEPFFESLGLRPSELPSLVPQNLMYLGDDNLLLENFHVLCNYGVPRGRTGGMYREASGIFRYEYGLLDFKLKAYEDLGLSETTVIKLVSCCPSVLIGGVNSEFVKVLQKLNILGLKNDWIGGYLTGKESYNWRRMLDTINFLGKVGYSEEQLHNLFKTNPALLFESSGKKVYVLFGRLLKLGLEMNKVYSLFIQNPQILSARRGKNLSRAIDVLLYIGMGAEETVDFICMHVELLCSSSVTGPKILSRELKATKDSLCQIIKEDPLKLFHSSSNSLAFHDPSKQLEKTTFLLRLGYVENSDEMMMALKKFRGRGDHLQERFDCLVQAGLDINFVSSMIKQAPMVLNLTKDVIVKKIDCLVNLGYPLDAVVGFPAYLCYDMQRIDHRFRMYQWLRERNSARPMLSLSTILACSDARFEKYFVFVHPEGPTMWESIRNSSVAS